ncbi:MAG: NAD(P)H-dependent oxidoreductase [Crocinitomicaceae bacterium]|nr:NAD(P)H-dependent oxidoreductase [Crocinitomicaceae bacterium]
MNTIENLKWRYATKKFDASQKLAEEEIDILKEAIQLSPSSYGLQLFKVMDVRDELTRKALQPAAWGQTQIVDASNLFVFAAKTKFDDSDVDNYVHLKASSNGMDPSSFKGYSDFVKGKLSGMSEEEYQNWTKRQVYIALGNLMTVGAELKIDICPMEGFEAEKFDEILGLKSKGYTSTVNATIGYRSEEDSTADSPKIRKSVEDLFEIL